ncbi:MAG TPA: hypothetical protein VK438_19025 [Xanthobacteraceae bacterium]|nr:hypothetical protein [Xanthobacteraceae bacterium]
MINQVSRRRFAAAFALAALVLGLALVEARQSNPITVAGEIDYLALNPEQE